MGLRDNTGSSPGRLAWLSRIVDGVDRAVFRVEEVVAAIALVAMVICVFAEVVFRYVLNAPLAWTEELARLSLIWLTFAAGAVVFRSRSHIRIDLLLDVLPRVPRSVLLWLIEIGLVVVLLVLAPAGWMMTVIFWPSRMTVTAIPVGIMYLPVGLFCTAMIVHSLAIFARGETTSLPSQVAEEGAQP